MNAKQRLIYETVTNMTSPWIHDAKFRKMAHVLGRRTLTKFVEVVIQEDPVYQAAMSLIVNNAASHDYKTAEEFICPDFRKLAEALEFGTTKAEGQGEVSEDILLNDIEETKDVEVSDG